MKGCYLQPPCMGFIPQGPWCLVTFSSVHSLLCRIWAVEISCWVFCSSAWFCFDCWQTYGNFDPICTGKQPGPTHTHTHILIHSCTPSYSALIQTQIQYTHFHTYSRSHRFSRRLIQKLAHPLSHVVSETPSPSPAVSPVILVES